MREPCTDYDRFNGQSFRFKVGPWTELLSLLSPPRIKSCMRFYINILTTYFPDLDPPYDTYYQQILEQIELAE
jgi:hypothetical protein